MGLSVRTSERSAVEYWEERAVAPPLKRELIDKEAELSPRRPTMVVV